MNAVSRARPYVCRSCRLHQQRRRYTLTTSDVDGLANGFARLRSRRLLAVHGHDAAHFLQGLTTQNIPTSGLLSSPSNPQALYSAFMNAQGRLLHDVFIYPLHPQHALRELVAGDTDGSSTPSFLIEVDAQQLKSLQAFLRKYKLRAKVAIRALDEDEMGIYSVWKTAETQSKSAVLQEAAPNSKFLVASDPRIPQPWERALAADPANTSFKDHIDLPEAEEHMYKALRYLHGIPEGQSELPREETLLHEANLDLMHGVDFRKGCYVGQELVIRTQHTGVVRKRVMPIQIEAENAPPLSDSAARGEPEYLLGADGNSIWSHLAGQNLKSQGAKRPEGKILGGISNIGLALCRLEKVVEIAEGAHKGGTKILEMDAPLEDGQRVRVKPFVPDWWEARGKIMEGGYESLKVKSPGGNV